MHKRLYIMQKFLSYSAVYNKVLDEFVWNYLKIINDIIIVDVNGRIRRCPKITGTSGVWQPADGYGNAPTRRPRVW